MVIICVYKLKEDYDGSLRVINGGETIPCPICVGMLLGFGVRERKYIEADEDRSIKILIIRRLKCESCYKIHHELPDILIPYKRHCGQTVEKIIQNDFKGMHYEHKNGTIRRILCWWKALLEYLKGVMNSLKAKYGIEPGEHITPKEIVRAAVNAHLWISTRSASASG